MTGLAVEARIAAGPGVRTVTCGGRAHVLQAALEREIARGARGVISFGIAGGLAPDVAAGRWIVARAVVASDARWACDTQWTRALERRLPGVLLCDVAGVDEPLIDAADKRAIFMERASAIVDTESHVAARIAAAHGLPFPGFFAWWPTRRGEAFRLLAATALESDGTVDRGAVMRALVRSPGQLPRLMRTTIDAAIALAALSRGRRLLGRGLGFPDLDQLGLHVT